MYPHEQETLERISRLLKERFSNRIVSVHAFGSRVRGDFREWSDFDLLIVVRDKTPDLESEIIGLIVDEEIRKGLSFSPVVKDREAFESEKRFGTPFYENVMKEGVEL
ncbi:MAG: nucleotidyltransferase domain-containing protein [Nitrospirae bacterium]|nr:nucleotidyltransferase domain-containing protein [Nitrospirota bacterium]